MDSSTRHLLRVGALANAFEWYEYSVFGFLAGSLGQLFFKPSEPVIGLIEAFFTFALTYLARPIGGLLFGLLGNQIGRNAALRLSLILMSVPTVLIGLLPTWHSIGITATFGLVFLRLIQGLATGGEMPSTAHYIFESSSPKNRNLLCSITVASPTIGVLLGSLVIFLLTYFFDPVTILRWAWRIPFLLSIPLTLFILWIRSTIKQSDSMLERSTIKFSDYKSDLVKPLIAASLLLSFLSSFFYIFFIWLPTYTSVFLNASPGIAYFSNTFSLAILLPLYLVMGYRQQLLENRTILLLSMSIICIASFCLFKGLQIKAPWRLLLILQGILSIGFVGFDSLIINILGKLFPKKTRILGFSLAFTLPAALIGGTAPLLCTYIIYETGWLMFPAFYILFFGLLSLPIILRL